MPAFSSKKYALTIPPIQSAVQTVHFLRMFWLFLNSMCIFTNPDVDSQRPFNYSLNVCATVLKMSIFNFYSQISFEVFFHYERPLGLTIIPYNVVYISYFTIQLWPSSSPPASTGMYYKLLINLFGIPYQFRQLKLHCSCLSPIEVHCCSNELRLLIQKLPQ